MIEAAHQCEYHDGAPCAALGYEVYNTDNEPAGYYCPEHALQLGHCALCGHFWGGIESFDFGSGLCEHCESEVDDGIDDDDGAGELDPDFDYPTYEDF